VESWGPLPMPRYAFIDGSNAGPAIA
jgi:hypothetical protein